METQTASSTSARDRHATTTGRPTSLSLTSRHSPSKRRPSYRSRRGRAARRPPCLPHPRQRRPEQDALLGRPTTNGPGRRRAGARDRALAAAASRRAAPGDSPERPEEGRAPPPSVPAARGVPAAQRTSGRPSGRPWRCDASRPVPSRPTRGLQTPRPPPPAAYLRSRRSALQRACAAHSAAHAPRGARRRAVLAPPARPLSAPFRRAPGPALRGGDGGGRAGPASGRGAGGPTALLPRSPEVAVAQPPLKRRRKSERGGPARLGAPTGSGSARKPPPRDCTEPSRAAGPAGRARARGPEGRGGGPGLRGR